MIFSRLKVWLIGLFSREVLKASLKYLLRTAGGNVFTQWLVKYIVKNLTEEIATPIINMSVNELGYQYEKIKGKATLKKIQNAENQTEYDSAIDDIYKRM